MDSILAKLNHIILIVTVIIIYFTKGPPCKSWSLKTFLSVYILRNTLLSPTKNLENFRINLNEAIKTQPQNSKTEKVLIHSKFRQQAHQLVKDYLKKMYGDSEWYDEESHWSSAKPLEAEWMILNYLNLSAKSNVIFYIHGGAYAFGNFGTYRANLETIAKTSDSIVFGAIYRLAPESSAPCQFEDVLAQVLYLTSPIDKENPNESGMGLNFDQIVVSGDSAGGGLSSALMHFMRDRQIGKFAGAVLFSPWVDVTSSHPSCYECVNTDFLHKMNCVTPNNGNIYRNQDAFWAKLYLGSDESIRRAMLKRGHPYAPLKYVNTPIISPLCDTKFHNLPPILIITGEVETLRDDSYRYHELINNSYTVQELIESKIPPSTLHFYEEMFHVFPMILPDLDASKVSFVRASNFIRQCFTSKLETFENVQVHYPINTELKIDKDTETNPHQWSNLYISKLNHHLVPFKPKYPRGRIQTWSSK